MDWHDLKSFLDIPASDTSQDVRIQACWTNAGELLTLKTAKAWRPIPQTIYDDCQLRVGKNLFDSRASTSGGDMYQPYPSTTVVARASRDPLKEVEPILAMYVVLI